MKKTTKFTIFVFVLIAHIILLFDWSIVRKPPPPPLGVVNLTEVTILPIQPKISTPKNSDDTQGIEPVQRYKRDERICNNKDGMYFGVGFVYNPGSQVITYIPEDYPAYKSGMRLGDIVVNPEEAFVGEYIDLFVIRGREQLHFHVKGDNICYQSKEKVDKINNTV